MKAKTQLEILVATRNRGKVTELSEALRDLPLRLRRLDEFANIEDVEETGNTYAENAALKAVGYSEQTGLYSLADDSGLEVDALGGMPGLFSNRFGGHGVSDQDRIRKLLKLIADKPAAERTARFVCHMAFVRSPNSPPSIRDDGVIHVSEGTCEGHIADVPAGQNGFGFDPIFVPAGYDKTFGQLDDQTKGRISHRAKALFKMREFLKGFLNS